MHCNSLDMRVSHRVRSGVSIGIHLFYIYFIFLFFIIRWDQVLQSISDWLIASIH
jgi:hypothetical protein